MSFEYFNPVLGLVTEYDPTSENGGLFLAQFIVHKPDARSMILFLEKMSRARLKNGMYMRSEHHTKRSVSHDEITGMMASSYMLNTIHVGIIWRQLKENFGAYPSIVEDYSDYLPYNLANYYCWGEYAGSKFSKLFLPFYIISMLLTCNKEKQDTSGKLVYWLELNSMPKTKLNLFLKSIFDKKMTKMYGSNFLMELRKIYFHTEKEDFPLFKVS